jgi:hypothetical protein
LIGAAWARKALLVPWARGVVELAKLAKLAKPISEPG